MSRYRNALAGQRAAVRALWVAVGVAVFCALVMGVGWMSAPSRLTVHLPPDLSVGAVVAPEDPQPPHVYTYGYYVWQQLYRWPKDGAEDYLSRIESLMHYMTPGCYQDRLDDFAARRASRELSGRRRAVWEIPGRGYRFDRVHREAPGTWIVTLDLQIEETILGETVKHRLATYRIRVVRRQVDPARNPWGMAVDCLAGPPQAIGVE